MKKNRLLLANPRGFCAGVVRAIAIVERALEHFGAPIYVRHEVVHNAFVCNRLRQKGAVFIEDLADVPSGATLIFSAHGVSKAVREEAARRGFRVFDATCPLVTKVHVEVKKMHDHGKKVVMIGHKAHPEVEGTMGQVDDGMFLVEKAADIDALPILENDEVAYVTQTTLSIDDAAQQIAALKKRFANLAAPKKADICFATQNRQDAVKALARECAVIFVVGSANSSNSRRLKEVAQSEGARAFLIDDEQDIQTEWLTDVHAVGVTAGASAPEILIERVIAFLENFLQTPAQNLQSIAEEKVSFPLPPPFK